MKMMKLVFLALVSTAFCGVLVDKADFDSIGVELEDGRTNNYMKMAPKTNVDSKTTDSSKPTYLLFGDETVQAEVQTNTKVTAETKIPTETKVTPEINVEREKIYKEILEEMKTRTEFNTLKKTLETMLINQIANILTLDLTEVKQIKTMLVNKGLNPKKEHITSLFKIWLELPTTTETITPKTKVVHDTEMIDSVYRRVEKMFTNEERLKEDLMSLKDMDIIEHVRKNIETFTTTDRLQKALDTLLSQSSNNRNAVSKALLLFRWNVMSQKLFEVTKKLSFVMKECKFDAFKITPLVKDFYYSRSLMKSIKNKEGNGCLASKTQELWNQLNADDSVHNVDAFLIKSFLTVYMKEFVAPNGLALTHYYENVKKVGSLKKLITKSKLPIYVTLDVIYAVCRGHYSMFQDEIPSEVVKVTTEVCRASISKTFEAAQFVYYLYKEQLN